MKKKLILRMSEKDRIKRDLKDSKLKARLSGDLLRLAYLNDLTI